MKTSPTQRSLKHLRDNGWTVAIVERWNQYAKIRQDLFGGIDIVAIGGSATTEVFMGGGPVLDGHQTLRPLKLSRVHGAVTGVQSTSDSNVAGRRAKLLALPELRLWVECGNRLVIHGWGKKGARGKVKKWTLREVELTLTDFDNAAAADNNNQVGTGESGSVAAATTNE